MHIFFKCKVFSGGQRNLRGDQTLDDRIVGKVQEHCHMVCNTALLKGSAEEISYVMLDTHCGEYDGEILIRAAAKRSLLYDLCGKLVVRKTVAGKDRQLLSTDQCGQSVNRRNSGADIVTRVFTSDRI